MNGFSSKHLIFLILALSVCSMTTYTQVLTSTGKNNTWIAISVSSAIILIFMMYISKILKSAEKYSIPEIYENAAGKIAGKTAVLLLALTIFLGIIESSSVLTNCVHKVRLNNTPVWFIELFIIVPSIYMLKSKKNAIISLTVIITTVICIVGIFLAAFGFRYKHFHYLLPIMQNGFDRDFILTIFKSLGLYGFSFCAILFLDEINNKKTLLKDVLLGMLILIQIQIYSMISLLSNFYSERINTIYYPKIMQTQLINYYGFIENGELIVSFALVCSWITKYILLFYILIKLLNFLNINSKYNIYIISIIVYFISCFIAGNIEYLNEFIYFLCYVNIVNYIAIPFMLFTIFRLKQSFNKY